jgi:hypothetical protein
MPKRLNQKSYKLGFHQYTSSIQVVLSSIFDKNDTNIGLGHSLTIVGVEVKKDGSRSLLVFDPMYHDPPCISKLIHKTFQFKDPGMPLKAYRRGPGYLRKYPAFEVLWCVHFLLQIATYAQF